MNVVHRSVLCIMMFEEATTMGSCLDMERRFADLFDAHLHNRRANRTVSSTTSASAEARAV
jgi:hypothetical protein